GPDRSVPTPRPGDDVGDREPRRGGADRGPRARAVTPRRRASSRTRARAHTRGDHRSRPPPGRRAPRGGRREGPGDVARRRRHRGPAVPGVHRGRLRAPHPARPRRDRRGRVRPDAAVRRRQARPGALLKPSAPAHKRTPVSTSLAIPKNTRIPTTSTTVATNGVDEAAGSAPRRLSTIGSSDPTSDPHSTTPTSARNTTRPISGQWGP